MSLRALMLLIAVVAGWLGWICYRARVQREAVAAIEVAGGGFAFDWYWDSAERGLRDDTAEPSWLRRQLGPGFFEEVAFVRIADKADDALMLHVGRLDQLEWLAIEGGNVTDAGLVHIRNLRRLRCVALQHAPEVTAQGMANLSGLTRLEMLYLPIQAEDSYLASIEGLHALDELDLRATRVTDAGLAHLTGLNALTHLNLDETGISDEGLKYLVQLSGLKQLDLMGTRITDAELAIVANLINLESLDLAETAVTDAGLLHLAILKRCKTIDVMGTRVTAEGVAAMQAKCPWMTVSR
jgi:internalin A